MLHGPQRRDGNPVYQPSSRAGPNNGPSPASNFKLTLSIPPGATYAGSYYADDWLTCTEPPQGGQ